MLAFINQITHLGLKDDQAPYHRRNLTVTNYYSLIIFAFTAILSVVLFIYYQQYLLMFSVLAAGLFSLAPLIFNHLGHYNASRLYISLESTIATLIISFLVKTVYPEAIQPNNFFDVRFIILASVIIPLTTINLSERSLLFTSLSFSLIALTLFDPLHNLLGIGYFQLGEVGTDYYFSANFYSLSAYLFLLGGSLFLKHKNELIENQNDKLIRELNENNLILREKNKEIEIRNAEISKQSSDLIRANQTIAKQKDLLDEVNSSLKTELVSRNQALIRANEELAKHNHELRQYSYTISHNLRAPVARLLGLLRLLAISGSADEEKHVLQLIQQSGAELDEIISDLSKIIDIRDTVYRIREKVRLSDEWDKVRLSLEAQMTDDTKVNVDFSAASHVYAIRPFVHSVLHNLVSNALKYRVPNRPLVVNITSHEQPSGVELIVQDNGLGINLSLFSKDLFGMYKRFHTHTDGKGLGLYLVKSQLELMGGDIAVNSELNVGTSFTVTLPTPANIEGQVCYESEFGSIFYNAVTNVAGIVWHKPVTTEAYRELFLKSVEMVKLYRTPYWISDMRNQGSVAPEDQQWMVTTVLVDAIKFGLKRIAGVYDPAQHNEVYRDRIAAAGASMGVVISFYQSYDEAEEWVTNLAAADVT